MPPELETQVTLTRRQRPFIVALAWTLCFLWACFGVFDFFRSYHRSESAVQQAAVAGFACAWMLFGFIAARSIDGASARP